MITKLKNQVKITKNKNPYFSKYSIITLIKLFLRKLLKKYIEILGTLFQEIEIRFGASINEPFIDIVAISGFGSLKIHSRFRLQLVALCSRHFRAAFRLIQE